MADKNRESPDKDAPDPEAARYRETTMSKQGPNVDGQGVAGETSVDESGRALDLERQGRVGRQKEPKT